MNYDDWKCAAPDPREDSEYDADEIEAMEALADLAQLRSDEDVLEMDDCDHDALRYIKRIDMYECKSCGVRFDSEEDSDV